MVTRLAFILTFSLASITVQGQQFDKSQLDEVIRYTTVEIDNGRADAITFAMRGWAYHRENKLRLALKDYNSAISKDDGDGELYYRRAEIQFDLKDYKMAVSDYSKAIALSQDSLLYYVSRGVSYEKLGEYTLAIADYNFVILHDRTNQQALRNRAILFTNKLKDPDAGLADFATLLKLNPSSKFYHDRGRLLIKLGRYKEALDDFSLLVLREPQNSTYHANKGLCLGMTGNATFVKEFDEAIRLDKSDPYIYLYRAQVYESLKKYNEACSDLKIAKLLGATAQASNLDCK